MPARADEPAGTGATVVRFWIQPPVSGVTIGFGESPPTTVEPHFGAASIAFELPSHIAFEAGGGALLSDGRGPTLNGDAWVRGGVVPVLYRSQPSGAGWVLQLASTIGYRYMQRSKIVYEDYGVDVESASALALDVGPVLTHWSPGGTGLALRLLSGIIVPFYRSHSAGYVVVDSPRSTLRAAVPLGFDLGLAY